MKNKYKKNYLKKTSALFLSAFLLFLFCSNAFANDSFCLPEEHDEPIEDIAFKECSPYWLEPELEHNTTEIFHQNLLNALPNEHVLELNDFEPTVVYVYGSLINASLKKAYQDKQGTTWMMDFSGITVGHYIISGLYRLILGKYAPNEQLVQQEEGDTLVLGSEFIKDFVTYEDFTGSLCKPVSDGFLKDNKLKNTWLMIAAMILFGETDASARNIGFVCDDEKKLCYYAKIDHEDLYGNHSDILRKGNLKLLADDLSYRTKNSRNIYKNLLRDNNYNLAWAMEIISFIPGDMWQKVVAERARAYQEEGGDIPLGEAKIVEKFMEIKKRINFFIESLYLEGAILKNDIEVIKKLEAFGLDANKKYSYINIDSNSKGLPITPLEMAIAAKSQKVVEYFYPLSSDQTKITGIIESIYSSNEEVFNLFLEKDPHLLESLDANEKYFHITDKKNHTKKESLTPVEMAIKNNSPAIAEYFYSRSDNQTRELGIMKSILSDNVNMFDLFVEETPDILHSLDYYAAIIHNDSGKIFKFFSDESSIDFNSDYDFMHYIFDKASGDIYEQLIKMNQYTPDDYFSHFNKLMAMIKTTGNDFYNTKTLLKKILAGTQGLGAEKTKKIVESIIQNKILILDYEITKILMKEVQDDQFFIDKILKIRSGYDAKHIAHNLSSPKSCLSLLHQILNNEELMADIKGETSPYYGWYEVLHSLIDNSHLSDDGVIDALNYLLEKRDYDAAKLILKIRKIDPALLSKFEDSDITLSECIRLSQNLGYDVYKRYLDVEKEGVDNHFKSAAKLFNSCFGNHYINKKISCAIGDNQIKVTTFLGTATASYIDNELKKIQFEKKNFYWIKKQLSWIFFNY